MISVRPATREDFRAFYGREPPMTVRALAAISDNKPVGIGGYYLQGGVALAFTDHREEMSKKDRVRGAHALMAMLRELNVDVIALSEAAVVLRHFGFEPWGPIWKLAR